MGLRGWRFEERSSTSSVLEVGGRARVWNDGGLEKWNNG